MIEFDGKNSSEPARDAIATESAEPRSSDHRDDDVFACEASLTQDGLWFIDQVQPGRATYNIPVAFVLRGRVDWLAFRAAISDLVTRHESLRTSFAARNGSALQVISPGASVDVDHRSFTDTPLTQADVDAAIRAEVERPFDLSVAPLLRVKAFSLSEEHHVVTFVFHHIIADGWSIAVFFDELSQAYTDHLEYRPPNLPALAIDYADFSIWQRRRLTDDLRRTQLDYWSRTLAGAPDSLTLPVDRPRPAAPTGAGAIEWYTIGADTTNRLRELCRSEQATMFMAVLSALNVLLARHTDAYDLVIGSPMAGRVRQEIERTIGFFANTLAIRTTFAPAVSFRELLQRVRTSTLGAYHHSDVPFHQVVSAVRPGRSRSAHPVFQVMCAFQAVPDALLRLPGLQVDQINVSSGTAKFDLLFEFQERRDVVDASLEYSSELFDAETARRWIGRFVTLLESAARQPDVAVSRLTMLPPQEHAQIRLWSHGTPVGSEGEPWAKWSSIAEAFESHVRQTPDTSAVSMGQQGLTYRELSERSDRLAQYLAQLGGRPGTAIGLCIDRSLDLIVAVLGILKTGACYVPLDSAYPAQRLKLMADDADLKLVVTSGAVAAPWVSDGTRVVRLDTEWSTIALGPAEPLRLPHSPTDLAYVLYTSGSTGRPKGVAMSHAALLNLLQWQASRSKPSTRTLQFAPISFDVSFQEIFATLCSGGRLVLINDDDRRDAHRLLDIVCEEGITRLFVPFVALQALCEASLSSGRVPRDLTEVITAGEQLQATPSVVSFFQALPNCSLENQYGPTESHVVTAHRLEGAADRWPLLPPIGRPIANAQAWVLDQQLVPAPIGVPGELYLGGAALAEGYYRRPELTADRFIQTNEPSEGRLYRTGDAARWRGDGALEFLGRLDNQVKVRGHRVELGEIEAVLCTVPGIDGAVVNTVGDDASGRRLVAYVTSSSGPIDSPKVREHLKALLPEYMVPSTFVQLDQLPLTPSGKVNRAALPAPGDLVPDNRSVSRPPQTDTERELHRIWCELLQVEQVGIDESFFDLGGHSLLAMKMFARIHRAFGRSIPFSTLIQRPTIGNLAKLLDPQSASRASSCIVPLRTGGSRPPIFFIHGLGNEVWTFVELAKALHPEQVVYGIQPAENTADHVSLAEMAEKYVQEILTLVPNGPFVLGGFCSGAVMAFEIARQLKAGGKQVDLLVVFDYWMEEVPVGVRGFLTNLGSWVAEDLLHTSLDKNFGRIRSKLRQLRSHLLPQLGSASTAVDVRDQLGMWRYPDHEVRRLRKFFDAMVAYRFVPYDGPIHVFRARTRRFWGRHPAPDMGWGRVATGSLKVETVPGSHDTMFRPPFVALLANRLTQSLQDVFERRPSSVTPPVA